jgi:RNA polymerase sigma-70 factor (ECF subfamily)
MSLMLRAFLENERGIKRFLSRFFSRAQDVDDLAQETFLRAFAAEAERDVLSPRAFLYRIAKNLALNERDRLSNRTTRYMEDFPDPTVLGTRGQVSGEDVVEGRQKMAMFAEAVSALPPQCRRVFLLRKVHGLSQRDVAQRLGLSVSTVEKHVALGLLKCSEYLKARGYEVGTGGISGAGAKSVPDPDTDVLPEQETRRGARAYGSKGGLNADV